MSRYKFSYLILAGCISGSIYANEVNVHSLDHSINTCYPSILNAVLQKQIAEAKAKQNKSPFDTRVNAYANERQGSTYNTQYQKLELEKRFYDSPVSVYTGFDISSGYAPQYEGAQITSAQGREFVGLRLNLLSGFAIDKDRLALYNAVLDTDRAKYEVELAKLLIKTDAMKAYVSWLISGEQLDAYTELFNIANKRQKALEKSYKNGDVAKILLTENNSNLLKRQVRMASAQNAFNQASQSLSLYFRDNKCNIVVPTVSNIPGKLPKDQTIDHQNDDNEVNQAIRNRPEFKIIEVQLKQLENQQTLAKTELLPKLDLQVQYNQNNSNTATTPNFLVNQNEGLAKLHFSLPLERSLGKGLSSEASKNFAKLYNERKLLMDQITARLNSLHYIVNNTANQIDLSNSELKLSKELLTAEKTRFDNGDSNFFMLNTREENVTNSYLLLLNSLADNYNAYIEYNFLNGRNIHLVNTYLHKETK